MNKSADEADRYSLQAASPYSDRARQRLIGALVLVAVVSIIMPIFFHGEPRIPSLDPKISLPSRDAAGSQPGGADESKGSEPQSAADTAKSAEAEPQATAVEPEKTGELSQAGGSVQAGQATATGQLGQSNQASVLEAKQAPAIQADAGKSNAADQVVRQPYPERYPDRYVLQAGAYSQSENADAQVARLKKLGVKVYTDRIKTPKGERVRVRVGPFANKADAVKVQTKLRQAQIETALAGPDA
ncbi:MAG: hypothetical protein EBZ03_07380 [Betaproteobacteria bacterium]|nr:SPOR domain-containing protein [Pseudomonadota bacterium]NBO11515.1 hypothetical protein [Betaproteobacteria bacterium]NBO44095.1 hypothetical protein [Betaproteobacteria bacterium]NBP11074.1 hypothetical protein [Betaproteobacteria bacterium]NBP62185.1 hypothetical protein [Betaproteobacteria bacterium]